MSAAQLLPHEVVSEAPPRKRFTSGRSRILGSHLVRRMLVVHRQTDGSFYRLVQLLVEGDISMEGRTDTVSVSELLTAVPRIA
jgi:hypothetical protein